MEFIAAIATDTASAPPKAVGAGLQLSPPSNSLSPVGVVLAMSQPMHRCEQQSLVSQAAFQLQPSLPSSRPEEGLAEQIATEA